MGTHHTGTQDHDLGRIYARHTAEQHAETTVRLLKTIGASLNSHAPGDLRHRCEQWQTAKTGGDGLVSNTGCATVDQIAGLLRIGRKVQIGKQNLAIAQHGAFSGLRLLDLDDHFGALEDFRRGVDNFGTDRCIISIANSNSLTCRGFNHHLVTVLDCLAYARRCHADTVLVILDFFRNTYQHENTLLDYKNATLIQQRH